MEEICSRSQPSRGRTSCTFASSQGGVPRLERDMSARVTERCSDPFLQPLPIPADLGWSLTAGRRSTLSSAQPAAPSVQSRAPRPCSRAVQSRRRQGSEEARRAARAVWGGGGRLQASAAAGLIMPLRCLRRRRSRR